MTYHSQLNDTVATDLDTPTKTKINNWFYWY